MPKLDMTFGSIDYASVFLNVTMKSIIEDVVKDLAVEIFKNQSSSSITAQDVYVLLSQGSMRAEATITPPTSANVSAFVSAVNDTNSMLAALAVQKILTVPFIYLVTTGNVTATISATSIIVVLWPTPAPTLPVPADSEVLQIGEFTQVGPGNLVIGTPMTLSTDSRHFLQGRALTRTFTMFIDWFNNVRGGIHYQGSYRSLQIKLIDDHGNSLKALEATRRLRRDGVRLLLGPAVDELAKTVAEEVNRSGLTMVAPRGFDHTIYDRKPQVFGVQSPPRRALPKAFEVLMATSSPPTRVAYVSQDHPTWIGVCSNVQELAAQYNLHFLGGLIIGYGPGRTPVAEAVSWMKRRRADLVVGCSPATAHGICKPILQEAQRQSLNPKAFAMTMCIANGRMNAELGDAARWVAGTIPWSSTLPFKSAAGFGTWTASSFVAEYNNLYAENPPTEAASAWASLCMLVAAIERADSDDPALVAAQLRSMSLETIYGNVSFGEDGQSVLDWSVAQIQQFDMVPKRLSPYGERDISYPTPPWADRSCNNNDIPESKFGYNANGSCSLCPEVASYNTTVQRRVCETCRVNHTLTQGSLPNASYCQPPCLPGRYGKDCLPCPTGTYGANLVCHDCALGRYSSVTGSVDCTDCPQGTFAGVMGMTHCSLCNPGTFIASNGSVSCTTCDFGKNASQFGMVECVLCKPGWVARDVGKSHCEPCSVGTRSLWGSQECQPCPANSYQPSAGSDTCLVDRQGQLSEQIGTPIPENQVGFWALGGGRMEYCKFDPAACKRHMKCAEGHTGRQCFTCLPGYSRSKASCISCPHRVLNMTMTVLVMLLAIFAGLLGGRFVIGSMGRPQDTIVIVLSKQLLNHCVNMSICYTVLMNLFRERALAITVSKLWVAQAFAAPLNMFDGCIPTETVVWSVSCLTQPFGAQQAKRLQDALHTDYYSPSLAADRDYVRSVQVSRETVYSLFWLFWPACFIVICNVIGFSMLYTKLSRNKEFYSNAFQFYKEVKEQGFKQVGKKYMERRRKEYIDAYFYRINGIWSPVDHVLRLNATHTNYDTHKLISKRLYQEESTVLKSIVVFVTYAPVGRALIRPILCRKLGSPRNGLVEAVIDSSGAVTCSADHPVLWIATIGAFIWFVIVPARLYFKLWKVHDRLHLREMMKEYGFSTSGYKWDFWWWDPVIFIRKALCFLVEAMPFVSEKERIMGLLVISIGFFVLEFYLSPYDDRCNGLFHRLELQQLALFIFATLLLQLFDDLTSRQATMAGYQAIVVAGLLALLHVLYMGTVIYNITMNTWDVLVSAYDTPRLRDKPLIKTVVKYLRKIYEARIRDSPYVAFDPLYGWVTICGSHGDIAVPPYIPKGSMAKFEQDVRPKLSNAPMTPETEGVERSEGAVAVADCWQRMELQRILSMSLLHIAATHESGPVFSLSITEFVIRVAFVLCKGDKTDRTSGPEEVDRHVWAKALVKSDPLTLMENAAGGRDQGDANADANADDYVSSALLMEEDLQKAFSAARSADRVGGRRGSNSSEGSDRAGGPRPSSSPQDGEGDEVALNPDEEEKVMRIKRERYEALVHDMFSPSTFRRGLMLQKLQFALMQLQTLPRSDLVFWQDLFEEKWLHEKAACHSELERMAGRVVDASEESNITRAKPKPSAALHATNAEEIMAFDVALQASPLLAGPRALTNEFGVERDEAPDPSLHVALRWLFLVMEVQNTFSLSSLRKTLRPVDRRRDKLVAELKKLQEETARDEGRIRELRSSRGSAPSSRRASLQPESPARGSQQQPESPGARVYV